MTSHRIYTEAARKMSKVGDGSVELVVTSPPYPMIEMWDEIMAVQNPKIADALKADKGNDAFELMHKELDKVWSEVCRVVAPGGFVCINIGDATRTIGGEFALYSNHSRIINYFVANGFVNLPNILWRKQTNAPNKFMGSSMMPAGAYVTLEHEWILAFRKGGKREFKSEAEKLRRRESSFFWEERNVWFSDLWDNIKGTKQKISKSESRDRSAAYPLEIPYRLINMYSLQGDTVLDTFLGTGTTTIAAIMTGRNSIGYEIDKAFEDVIYENICSTSLLEMNAVISNRIDQHRTFIVNRLRDNKEIKHHNGNLNMPVVTSQETEIKFSYLSNINFTGKTEVSVEYSDIAVEQVAITLPASNAAIKSRKKVVPAQIALPL